MWPRRPKKDAIINNLTCVTALSSDCKVHRTAAGKAEATNNCDSGLGFSPFDPALARTKVCNTSKATACNPRVTLAPSVSRIETKVGTSLDSMDAVHPGVKAMTLKMSWAKEVNT